MALSKRVKRVNRVKGVLSGIGLPVGGPVWVKCIAGHRNLDHMPTCKKLRRNIKNNQDYELDIEELARIGYVLAFMLKAL